MKPIYQLSIRYYGLRKDEGWTQVFVEYWIGEVVIDCADFVTKRYSNKLRKHPKVKRWRQIVRDLAKKNGQPILPVHFVDDRKDI